MLGRGEGGGGKVRATFSIHRFLFFTWALHFNPPAAPLYFNRYGILGLKPVLGLQRGGGVQVGLQAPNKEKAG